MGSSVETAGSRGNGSYAVGSTDEAGHETNRVLGGYKATLHSEYRRYLFVGGERWLTG